MRDPKSETSNSEMSHVASPMTPPACPKISRGRWRAEHDSGLGTFGLTHWQFVVLLPPPCALEIPGQSSGREAGGAPAPPEKSACLSLYLTPAWLFLLSAKPQNALRLIQELGVRPAELG